MIIIIIKSSSKTKKNSTWKSGNSSYDNDFND